MADSKDRPFCHFYDRFDFLRGLKHSFEFLIYFIEVENDVLLPKKRNINSSFSVKLKSGGDLSTIPSIIQSELTTNPNQFSSKLIKNIFFTIQCILDLLSEFDPAPHIDSAQIKDNHLAMVKIASISFFFENHNIHVIFLFVYVYYITLFNVSSKKINYLIKPYLHLDRNEIYPILRYAWLDFSIGFWTFFVGLILKLNNC